VHHTAVTCADLLLVAGIKPEVAVLITLIDTLPGGISVSAWLRLRLRLRLPLRLRLSASRTPGATTSANTARTPSANLKRNARLATWNDVLARVVAVIVIAVDVLKIVVIQSLAFLQPHRIDRVHRIVADIGIEVRIVGISDRIGLHEPHAVGVVHPRLVVIEPELGQPHLSGVLEPADVRGAGPAIFVVGVDSDQRAAAVGSRDHAPALVGGNKPAVGASRAVVPDQQLVGVVAAHVALADDRRRHLGEDDLVAVVDELLPVGAVDVGVDRPEERVIADPEPAAALEVVLRLIPDVDAAGGIEGQVAVGVVARGCAVDRRELVEAVAC
jgi:hypothetical protein